jgi:hypothetical protein
MEYSSSKTVASKKLPGVVFVLKRMNGRRRDEVEDLQAAAAAKLKPLFAEFAPLDREYREAVKKSRAVGAAERKAAIAAGATEREALVEHPHGPVEFADEKFAKWAELKAAIARIERRELEPVALRYVVEQIEGLTIDGQPADVELLAEKGPDDLRGELVLEVQREMGLLPAEAENLSSPSTSAGVVDGGATTGSVGAAGTPATITGAAAGSSTGPGNAGVPNTGSTR